jgi:hypothetical protein
LWEQDRELLAAISSDDVPGAMHARADHISYTTQTLVSGGMAENVVEALNPSMSPRRRETGERMRAARRHSMLRT